jgi:hypothetical protein
MLNLQPWQGGEGIPVTLSDSDFQHLTCANHIMVLEHISYSSVDAMDKKMRVLHGSSHTNPSYGSDCCAGK